MHRLRGRLLGPAGADEVELYVDDGVFVDAGLAADTLVDGGFLEDTPWVEHAAATRPYVEDVVGDATEKHVMLVHMGENAFLVALESFLHEEVG